MKKSLITLLLLLPTLTHANPIQHVFAIGYPNMSYFYWNDEDTVQRFQIFVEKTFHDKPADNVTLICNGEEKPTSIDNWTSCDVKPHKPVSFTITDKNFKNGASGASRF